MRSLIVTFLTGLILACPFVCGVDEDGHDASHGHAAGSNGGDHAPTHCPESSDNCVCQGAVQTGSVRAHAPDSQASSPLFLLVPPLLAAPAPHHLTWEGSPTGLASWGGTLTIRAWLQNFRC